MRIGERQVVFLANLLNHILILSGCHACIKELFFKQKRMKGKQETNYITYLPFI
jgi:hypothetical protein